MRVSLFPHPSARTLVKMSSGPRCSATTAAAISGNGHRALSSSTIRNVPLLLSPKEYKALPKNSTLPLDVSWHMPNSPRSAVAEYLSGPRIPRAKRFDLDEVAELSPDKNPYSLTHMLPPPSTFSDALAKLGIKNDTHVVVYDSVGVFSSPRALYTFKALGHDKVSVLDGGLPRWIDEGEEVEVGEVNHDHAESEYTAPSEGANAEWVRNYEQIVANSEKPSSDPTSEIVLDHRPAGRFSGSAPEPRPGLSSGHIPNSLSTPFASYLEQPSDRRGYSIYKSEDELKNVFITALGGEDKWNDVLTGDRKLIFTCGSGMTAAIGWLANEIVREKEGKAPQSAIYDESWTGYALRKESKIGTSSK